MMILTHKLMKTKKVKFSYHKDRILDVSIFMKFITFGI